MGTTVCRRQMAFTPIASKLETIAHPRHLLSEFDAQRNLAAGSGNTQFALVDSGIYSPVSCSSSSSAVSLKKAFPKSPHVNQYHGTLSAVPDRRLSGIRTSPLHQLFDSSFSINTDHVYENDALYELRKQRLHLKEQREVLSANLGRMQQKDAEIHENFFRLRHKRLLLDLDVDTALGCCVGTVSSEPINNMKKSTTGETDFSPCFPFSSRKRPHYDEGNPKTSTKKRRTSCIKREVNKSDRKPISGMYTPTSNWNTMDTTVFMIPPGSSISPTTMTSAEESDRTPCTPPASVVDVHGDTYMESADWEETVSAHIQPTSEEACSDSNVVKKRLQVPAPTPINGRSSRGHTQSANKDRSSPYRLKQTGQIKPKSALEELCDLQNALNRIASEGGEVSHLETTFSTLPSQECSPVSVSNDTRDLTPNSYEADEEMRENGSNKAIVICHDTGVYHIPDMAAISTSTLNPSSSSSDGYLADASSDSTDDQSENVTVSPTNYPLTLTPICNGLQGIHIPFPSAMKNTTETPTHFTPKNLESEFDEVSRYSIGCTLPGLTPEPPVPSSPQVIGCALPGLQRMRKRLSRTSSLFAPRRLIQKALLRRRSDTLKC